MASNVTFRAVLHKNAEGSPGEQFEINRTWTMDMFKKKAGAKLGIKVKHVFLPTGAEVTGCDEISANQDLYLSAGEPFFKGSKNASGRDAIGGGEKEFLVSVLGTGGVGKSALTLRFVRDFFVQDWDPTIEDAYRKAVDVDNKTCTLDILDTAGQDDFESLRPSWMIDKDGYLFVYSLDHPQSLEELKPFFELHQQINEGKRVPIVLVANKKDLAVGDKQSVAREAGIKRAQELGARYIETSAFTGENVQEAFVGLVREIRARRNPAKASSQGGCCVVQ